MIQSALGHTVRTATLLQVFFDFGFVFVGVVIAAMWVKGGLPIDFMVVLAYAAILAITLLAFNSWLGFYQRIHDRTVDDSRARGAGFALIGSCGLCAFSCPSNSSGGSYIF